MTSRERLVTALRHREPDRGPIDWGGGTTGIEIEAYDRLKALLGLQGPPTRTFVRDHAEIDEPILWRFGIDTRYVRVGAPRGYILQLDGDNSYVDIWGTRWRKPPSSLYHDMVEFPIKEATREALRRYCWPDPHDPGCTDGLRERARYLAEETNYAVVLDVTGFGVFEQGWALRGFENFLADLLAEPEFAEAVNRDPGRGRGGGAAADFGASARRGLRVQSDPQHSTPGAGREHPADDGHGAGIRARPTQRLSLEAQRKGTHGAS